ncbi:hypothetical protein NPIL_533781 [Nephila pilipes]|uniref:Uncharacterized protein n=1 Tax=Nephila pilipes TaxID=299642 RepID=A0A8X6U165_NEPPI|nr:hypothetical protein NPIL_533781 [Nephila pilipes]
MVYQNEASSWEISRRIDSCAVTVQKLIARWSQEDSITGTSGRGSQIKIMPLETLHIAHMALSDRRATAALIQTTVLEKDIFRTIINKLLDAGLHFGTTSDATHGLNSV